MPKITTKFELDHPIGGRKMQVGWVKIGHFWRKTRYNSKTVQDRRIVSIKVAKEVVWALSNGYVADDLWWSSTPNHPNFYIFRRLSYLHSEWGTSNLVYTLVV